MLTLLLIEDDTAIRDMLRLFLTSRDYRLQEAASGKQALTLLADENPDLILLDWMLPDTHGPALLQKLRDNPVHKDIPVIMLTARAEEEDKIKGLDIGADDYITKPFSLQELDARIRALIRRAHGLDRHARLTQGPLELDPDQASLRIHGEPVKIGPTEFRLLHYLMRKPGRLHSRSQLLDQVWGQGTFIEERTVDVHILRLRKLLKAHGIEHAVETVRGAGYRFNVQHQG